MASADDIFHQLEQSYQDTHIVCVTSKDGQLPNVEFDEGTSQNDAIVILAKAALFMMMNDLIYEVLEETFESEDEDDD